MLNVCRPEHRPMVARRSRLAAAQLALAMALTATPAIAAPERVVSVNLCTDQLAMLVAAPGQLVSVTTWAQDPSASVMFNEAQDLPANSALAEEVFLMNPDLVVASRFTSAATLDMLRRVGIAVETFSEAQSLDDIAGSIARMGALLGREDRAAELIARIEANLAEAKASAADLPAERGAYHYPNNYTSGAGTLAHDIMQAAGINNAAAELGLRSAARMPLEQFVMEEPFLIVTRHIGGTHAGRAYESAQHPALTRLQREGRSAEVEGKLQICGLPFVVEAIESLIDARR